MPQLYEYYIRIGVVITKKHPQPLKSGWWGRYHNKLAMGHFFGHSVMESSTTRFQSYNWPNSSPWQKEVLKRRPCDVRGLEGRRGSFQTFQGGETWWRHWTYPVLWIPGQEVCLEGGISCLVYELARLTQDHEHGRVRGLLWQVAGNTCNDRRAEKDWWISLNKQEERAGAAAEKRRQRKPTRDKNKILLKDGKTAFHKRTIPAHLQFVVIGLENDYNETAFLNPWTPWEEQIKHKRPHFNVTDVLKNHCGDKVFAKRKHQKNQELR